MPVREFYKDLLGVDMNGCVAYDVKDKKCGEYYQCERCEEEKDAEPKN